MSAYGTKLADHVGAKKCDMEEKQGPAIKKFFSKPENRSGIYFMWSSGHIVIVDGGQVHEFTNRDGGGYKTCDINDYPFRKSGSKSYWWTRKIPVAYGAFEPGRTVIQAKPKKAVSVPAKAE